DLVILAPTAPVLELLRGFANGFDADLDIHRRLGLPRFCPLADCDPAADVRPPGRYVMATAVFVPLGRIAGMGGARGARSMQWRESFREKSWWSQAAAAASAAASRPPLRARGRNACSLPPRPTISQPRPGRLPRSDRNRS